MASRRVVCGWWSATGAVGRLPICESPPRSPDQAPRSLLDSDRDLAACPTGLNLASISASICGYWSGSQFPVSAAGQRWPTDGSLFPSLRLGQRRVYRNRGDVHCCHARHKTDCLSARSRPSPAHTCSWTYAGSSNGARLIRWKTHCRQITRKGIRLDHRADANSGWRDIPLEWLTSDL